MSWIPLHPVASNTLLIPLSAQTSSHLNPQTIQGTPGSYRHLSHPSSFCPFPGSKVGFVGMCCGCSPLPDTKISVNAGSWCNKSPPALSTVSGVQEFKGSLAEGFWLRASPAVVVRTGQGLKSLRGSAGTTGPVFKMAALHGGWQEASVPHHGALSTGHMSSQHGS